MSSSKTCSPSTTFVNYLRWVGFGADKLESNDRDLLQKMVKFTQLLANVLIYRTVLSYTQVIKELILEGREVHESLLELVRPYRTEHLNRRGKYKLDFSRIPPEPDYAFALGLEGIPALKLKKLDDEQN